jgi:putative ABC transport system substrate-binding protein
MRRREFILGLAMLADVGRASAQGRARRVGVLENDPGGVTRNVLEAILKEKGWIVGQNPQIEYRITGGDTNLSRHMPRADRAQMFVRSDQHIYGRTACRTF